MGYYVVQVTTHTVVLMNMDKLINRNFKVAKRSEKYGEKVLY